MAELNSSPEKNDGKPARKKLNPRIDLTAMVDLAFLLITFFMLTTSLQKPKMFTMVMPDDTGEMKVPESRTLTICIGKNDQAVSYLGLPDKPIIGPTISNCANRDIRQVILNARKQVETTSSNPMIVIVKTSDKAVYGDIVNVLDELKIAGDPTYAIVEAQPKDIAMLKEHKVY